MYDLNFDKFYLKYENYNLDKKCRGRLTFSPLLENEDNSWLWLGTYLIIFFEMMKDVESRTQISFMYSIGL